jgi:hypothetical protein
MKPPRCLRCWRAAIFLKCQLLLLGSGSGEVVRETIDAAAYAVHGFDSAADIVRETVKPITKIVEIIDTVDVPDLVDDVLQIL